eukprot:15775734-Heterocapsa_arctica.AAC.1
MGHNNDIGSGFNDQDMDHEHRGEQYGEADPSAGRQRVQTGNGAHEFREEHAQAVPRCDGKRNTRKSARKASHGTTIQCGGEQQI